MGAGCRATTTPALQTSRVLQARRQLPLIPTVYGMHVLALHQAPVRSILLIVKLFCGRSHGLGVGVRRCVFACMHVHMCTHVVRPRSCHSHHFCARCLRRWLLCEHLQCTDFV